MCEGKSRLFLVFLQVVLSVLLVWFNTCGSTAAHKGYFQAVRAAQVSNRNLQQVPCVSTLHN